MANTTDNSDKILKKRRERDIKKRLFLIPKLLFIFVLVFLLISILFRSGDSVQTYTAVNGSIVEYVLADGYVFRDQEMITAPSDGYFECIVDEGERVKEGDTVAVIYKNRVDPAVTEEISELEEEILELETDDMTTDMYSGSAVRIELSISDEAQQLTQVKDNSSFSHISEYKKIFDDYINQKQYSSEGGQTKEQRLEALKSRLDELQSGAASEKEWVYAVHSGVFSSKIDGYEEALNIDKMGDATPKYLRDIKREDKTYGDTVSTGEEVCKIVDNYDWYFVGMIPEDEAENFEVGREISIKFYDLSDTTVSGEITGISRPEGGRVAVTVHSTKYVSSIYTTSKVSAEIFTESAEGIKVPSESLRVIDGRQGVYVVRLGVARFVPVNLLYNNKEWAIISSVKSSESGYPEELEIYDEVIINTKGIEDGKVVRQ